MLLSDLAPLATLAVVRSELAGREELEILEAGLTAALVRRDDLLDDGWKGEDHGDGTDEQGGVDGG